MDFRSVLLALLPIGLTLVNYAIIRDLLWGILLGNKKKTTAEKLRAQASGWGRFTQNYIAPVITKYQDAFKRWRGIKTGVFAFTVAQVIAFAILIALKVKFTVIAIICGVIVLFNIVLFGILMSKTETSTNKKSTKGTPWKFEN